MYLYNEFSNLARNGCVYINCTIMINTDYILYKTKIKKNKKI